MIQFDSRKIKKGDIFIAVKGLNVDGHDYIEEAFKKGASLVYGERDIKMKGYIKVKNSRIKLGELVSDFYSDPSSKIKVIGVTGTKGKTTTCHLIAHVLNENGLKTGLISTLTTQGFHTTNPDIVSLNKELSEMVKKGYKYAVVEVSSHGIHQGRVSGINFEVGVLTNIAPEHLDYHKTFREYKRVKTDFIKSTKKQILSPKSTKLKILEGDFNNINAQTAVDVASFFGVSGENALRALKTFRLPEGRLEEIKNKEGFRIFVDFAHTPDSLEAVLKYLKNITKNRLITVFGCASQRDIKKRSKMGKISSKFSDLSIFTNEDSRYEDPLKIIRQIKRYATNYLVIPERGEAISYAISNAKKGDVIAVLGKGHEKSMSYFGLEHPWSDQQFIKNQLSGYKDLVGIVLAGGKGKRMKSKIPKIMHKIIGRPMISYSFENLRNAGIRTVIPVLGYKRNIVLKYLSRNVVYAIQPKQLGTGNAVLNAFPKIPENTKTLLVINGDDSAFYTPETIRNVIKLNSDEKSVLTFVSLIKNDPTGLGRVLRDKKGNLVGTVEEKNATDEEKKVLEVNDGLYVFDYKWLKKNIFNIKKNSLVKEYYLTDLIKIALTNKEKVSVYKLPDSTEWQGINSPEELQEAEKKMTDKILQFN